MEETVIVRWVLERLNVFPITSLQVCVTGKCKRKEGNISVRIPKRTLLFITPASGNLGTLASPLPKVDVSLRCAFTFQEIGLLHRPPVVIQTINIIVA